MADSIPYTVVPYPTALNVGVFLLNFNHRDDGRNLKEAFDHDFQVKLPHEMTIQDTIIKIMKLAEY